MGFRVWGSRFKVLGFRSGVQDLGCRGYEEGVLVGFGLQGVGFRVWGLPGACAGARASAPWPSPLFLGSGFRVCGHRTEVKVGR